MSELRFQSTEVLFAMERQANPDRHSDPHTVIGSTYVLHPVILIACAVPTVEMITFDDTNLYPYNNDIRGRSIEGFVWQGTGDMGAFDGIGSPICDLGNSPPTDGYVNAIVSPPHALYLDPSGPAAGYVCAAPSSQAFSPQSVLATAAWRDGMALTLTGHDKKNGVAIPE